MRSWLQNTCTCWLYPTSWPNCALLTLTACSSNLSCFEEKPKRWRHICPCYGHVSVPSSPTHKKSLAPTTQSDLKSSTFFSDQQTKILKLRPQNDSLLGRMSFCTLSFRGIWWYEQLELFEFNGSGVEEYCPGGAVREMTTPSVCYYLRLLGGSEAAGMTPKGLSFQI